MTKMTYLPTGIMSPDHEMWDEFVDALRDRFDYCDGTHRTTRAILQEMNGINIKGTVKLLESQGKLEELPNGFQ